MKKSLIAFLTIMITNFASAQIGTTIIPGVQRDRLERALRNEMDVYAVSIIDMKEKKFENIMDDIFSVFDSRFAEQRGYSFTLLVEESFFNKQKHVVTCSVSDDVKKDHLFFQFCKSNTSTVRNMLFSKRELR